MTGTVFTDNIGKQLKPGDWSPIEPSRLNQFADVTEDHQYIHIDQQRAAESYLGGTICPWLFGVIATAKTDRKQSKRAQTILLWVLTMASIKCVF